MQEIERFRDKIVSDAASRALAEAEERRKLADEKNKSNPRPREINGRKETSDPTRYGDWENKGIISDF
ncbi:MAG: DUF1674 domain-containing protein [Parvibaculum sp.]|nr:DUF1674 domain-containing protein [Parvibaculum sp.]